MEQGLIFDIERFSTADGPGIRTVVFFKGCNLNCFWCHNPESLKGYPELDYVAEDCLGCGSCVGVCPNGCHFLTEGEHRLLRDKCTSCLLCAAACPVVALKPVGKYRSVEECMVQIREDIPFYRRGEGGVTLSGGEVLQQHDFAVQLLKACRGEEIHTAIETNLCCAWDDVEPLLPYLDLVMADIKHMDPQMHRRGTGADNGQVLANLRRLDESGIPIIIRTPVIPGYNDSPENIRETAVFLSQLKHLNYYELLSYNPMGNDKRRRMGYPVPQISVPGKEAMKALAREAELCGRPVWVDGSIAAQ